MAEILSQSEQTNLEALLNIGYKNNSYWIGLSDLAYEGKYEWQHSFTPLGEYNNWAAGQPNGNNERWPDDDCVLMMEDYEWGWDDVDCEKNQPWQTSQEIHALCQID